MLIPRSEDIIAMKGTTTTTALIKGKKYKGAIVVNPVAGFHFNVKVGDFASLYPSIIKNWNLGYATVNCKCGALWKQIMLYTTERVIYRELHKCLRCNNQCQVEEKMKQMLNINKDVKNIQQNGDLNTQKKPSLFNEIPIKSQCLTQKNENENNKGIKNFVMPIQNMGENEQENMPEEIGEKCEIDMKDGQNLNELPSLTPEETNARDAALMTNEPLKYIISMETKYQERKEIILQHLLRKIGTNCNCCVQIVTELFTAYECYSHKVANMQHWICTKNRAVESQLIGVLKDLRVKSYKKKAKDKTNPHKAWYSVSEQAIKVICNASYGVFGDDTFVLYCPPMPEYVTGIGRWIITQTIKHGQELGLNIIYGDTDSIFIKNPPQEVLDELLAWAKKNFDIDFELDKEYRYACLSARKKNYFGVLKDGTVDVKGLTGKKKHTPKIIKYPFEETKKLLAQVNTEADILVAKKAILKLVKSTYLKIKTRNFGDMENLAFHVTASKDVEDYDGDPQHIKAAKLLKAAGQDIGEGSDISFVKTKDKLKVKPTKLAKPDDIDITKYNEFLKSTFIQILEPLGLDWDHDILGICVMDRFLTSE